MTQPLTTDLLERCATDSRGPVALHLQQQLLPVEGRGAPFFPATFAMDDKYNIDQLNDGTLVALVDSVGAQANRMEPVFLEEELCGLVPQVTIRYGTEPHETVSLLEAGHRLGDAVVRSTILGPAAQQAFLALKRGDAEPMAKMAPTSLVFGAWDSRDTGVKVPRLVQATIRAWDVSRLRRSATYLPALDYRELGVVVEEEKRKKEDTKVLSERGFLHVPSTGDHGGIIANGPIRRDLTINLVQLRRLTGPRTPELRRYLLGLALVAATEPLDPFLRQGCLLVQDDGSVPAWTLVDRDGSRTALAVDRAQLVKLAKTWAEAFGVGPSKTVDFDPKLAVADMAKGKKK